MHFLLISTWRARWNLVLSRRQKSNYVMGFSTLLCFFLFCVATTVGQLFLGPCGPPPKHVEVDFQKYTGVWYSAATTAADIEKKTCGMVRYNYNPETEHLNFVSGPKTGHLVKSTSSNRREIKQVLDDFPRTWHFHILDVDYGSVAVEYRCLDGVFAKTEEVTILTREKPDESFENIKSKLDLTKVIPSNLLTKLRPVDQKSCKVAYLKPCSQTATEAREKTSNSSPLSASPLLALFASCANRMA